MPYSITRNPPCVNKSGASTINCRIASRPSSPATNAPCGSWSRTSLMRSGHSDSLTYGKFAIIKSKAGSIIRGDNRSPCRSSILSIKLCSLIFSSANCSAPLDRSVANTTASLRLCAIAMAIQPVPVPISATRGLGVDFNQFQRPFNHNLRLRPGNQCSYIASDRQTKPFGLTDDILQRFMP